MRSFLSLTIAAVLSSSSAMELSAQTNSYLGSQWISVGHPNVRIEINKNSLQKTDNSVTSEFAYFFYDSDKKQQYLAVKGKRIDSCQSKKFTNKQVKVIQAKAFKTYYEGEFVNELNVPPDQFDYYVLNPYHSTLLNRYLCNNLSPNYLKAGMNLSQAKQLLYTNGFRIVTQEETAVSASNQNICESNAPCLTCGNGWSGCYIDFWNSKTQVKLTVRVDYGHKIVIDTHL
ncbi:hypothetical protein [Crocosphaera chwakensis]|uniref:Uncharacterized protein n=1 Tax=Crocosphaera chwakensis CCY0110 TaxID=391612 RepID=A3IXU9_9CHRO|nr:hypothetical protein [Crocosphaera chwakensis]EAZ88707.1 hypothetical protein CY0110_14280 [Crocosphaera chwakensis CCY0110]